MAFTAYNHRDELVRAIDQMDKIKDDNQELFAENVRMQESLDELLHEATTMLPVVTAAIEYTTMKMERHHVPVPKERQIQLEAGLYAAVMTYQAEK